MELTKNDHVFIDKLINNVGFKISELYSTLEEILDNFLVLCSYIDLETTMYKEYELSIDKCALITKYVEDEYIPIVHEKIQNGEDYEHLAFSINRFLNRLRYEAKGIDYSLTGMSQHMVDLMTQILYSELLNEANHHPECKGAIINYAYTRLNMSPCIEQRALKNKYQGFNFYENYAGLFLDIKRQKRELDSNKGIIKKPIPPLLDLGDEIIYNDCIKMVIEPDLESTFDKIIQIIKEDEFDIDKPDVIVLLTTLKTLLAMYSESIRVDLYEKYYIAIRNISNNNEEILDIFEELFWQTESVVVPKIININFGIRERKK